MEGDPSLRGHHGHHCLHASLRRGLEEDIAGGASTSLDSTAFCPGCSGSEAGTSCSSGPAQLLAGATVAPPPSKRPLVSNCPPATVSGPAQPLVGVSVGPSPCRLYIKAPEFRLWGRWFFDTIVCHVVC